MKINNVNVLYKLNKPYLLVDELSSLSTEPDSNDFLIFAKVIELDDELQSNYHIGDIIAFPDYADAFPMSEDIYGQKIIKEEEVFFKVTNWEEIQNAKKERLGG